MELGRSLSAAGRRWLVPAVLAAVFFLPLSPVASDVFLGIAAVLWSAKLWQKQNRRFYRGPADRWIAALAGIAALSVFVSPEPGFSFYNYYNLMGRYLLLYYLVLQNITELRQVKRLVSLLAAAAVLVSLYGIYQYVFGIDATNILWVDGEQFPELKKRVFSTLQNPNILAGYLLVMMTMAFGMFCKLRTLRFKAALAALFLLLGICLVMTYSRGALLSLAAVIGAYGVFKERRVLIPIALLAGAAFVFDPALVERVASSFSASDTSSNMRLGIWESTLAMIIDHPVLGIGWGAFSFVYPAYDFFIQNDAVKIVHAHNMYLNFAAETGLLGLLAFLGVFGRHAALALSSTRLRQSRFLNGLLLGAGLSMLATAVNGLTDYVLFNIELSKLFWLICALIVAASRRSLD